MFLELAILIFMLLFSIMQDRADNRDEIENYGLRAL